MLARLSLWKTHRIRRARLLLERLEDRSLLSASTLLNTSTLLLVTDQGQVQKVYLDAGADPHTELARYQAQPGIVSAEFDYVGEFALVPNDTRFGELWGLQNTGQSIQGVTGVAGADISATAAWNLTTGSTTVVVGINDSGIDIAHPDLYLNIWINQGEIPANLGVVDTNSDGIITFHDLNHPTNASRVTDFNGNGYIDGIDLLRDSRWRNGTDDDGNGYIDDIVGWDFGNNDPEPEDNVGHGTHVAGTVAAMGNNNLGVVGVAFNTLIAALKLGDLPSNSGAIAAVNYAVDKGILISNNSYRVGFSNALNTAIRNAQAANHVFVAAAGNSNMNNDAFPTYPANYNQDNIISVAASDNRDRRANFSNFGRRTVDLAAPGVDILSTVPTSVDPSGYDFLSGTSMAAPHVAGVAALIYSYRPNLTYRQVISRILNSVDPLPNWTSLVVTGGRLNALKALEDPPPVFQSGPRILSVMTQDLLSVRSLEVTFDRSINPSTFTTVDITGFTGPGGRTIVATSVVPIAGSNNTRFQINFPAQSQAGDYVLTIGPNIADTAGNLMNQNGNGVNGEAADAYTASFVVATTLTTSFTPSARINDFRTTTSKIHINGNFTVEDLNVRLHLTHTQTRDLHITLTAPNGQTITLVNKRGLGRNFSNTIFDDQAGQSILVGRAPFSGSFRPEQPLSTFNGVSGRGAWTLSVTDTAARDTGVLNSWALMFTSTETATPLRKVGYFDASMADGQSFKFDSEAVVVLTGSDGDSDSAIRSGEVSSQAIRDAVFVLQSTDDDLRRLSQSRQQSFQTNDDNRDTSERDEVFADFALLGF